MGAKFHMSKLTYGNISKSPDSRSDCCTSFFQCLHCCFLQEEGFSLWNWHIFITNRQVLVSLIIDYHKKDIFMEYGDSNVHHSKQQAWYAWSAETADRKCWVTMAPCDIATIFPKIQQNKLLSSFSVIIMLIGIIFLNKTYLQTLYPILTCCKGLGNATEKCTIFQYLDMSNSLPHYQILHVHSNTFCYCTLKIL